MTGFTGAQLQDQAVFGANIDVVWEFAPVTRRARRYIHYMCLVVPYGRLRRMETNHRVL